MPYILLKRQAQFSRPFRLLEAVPFKAKKLEPVIILAV